MNSLTKLHSNENKFDVEFYFLKISLRDSFRMNILIAGGAGFIGKNLCKTLLEKNHKVICVDCFLTSRIEDLHELIIHPNFTLVEHNIIEPLKLDTYQINQIYHLACPASPLHYQQDDIYTLDTNYLGTKNLLELATAYDAKFLLASTSEVYGEPKVNPQPEAYYGNVSTYGPRACYDEGKRISETLTFAYAKKYNLQVSIARIFNTYGPGMQIDDGRVICEFITKLLKNEAITIFGNGDQTRSFCYIDDLVKGLILLMNSNYSKPLNLGKDDEISISNIAHVVQDILGKKLNIHYVEARENDPLQRKPDLTLAQKQLNWVAETSLLDGLHSTINYFEDRMKLKNVKK